MNPAKVPKIDTNMAEKTPVSLLQELSIREFGTSPYYEQMPNESDPKLFSCLVEAFGKAAIGSGRSKKEAKHDASAKIIGEYMKIAVELKRLLLLPSIGYLSSYPIYRSIYCFSFCIGMLQTDDQFRDKLTVIPPTPKQTTDSDAVGRLLDICVQRNWPIAEYV